MKEITSEKLNELVNNPEFTARMDKVKSGEDLLSILSDYGFNLTEEELDEGYKKAKEIFETQGFIEGDELTEKYLEEVAGGLNTRVSAAGVAAGTAGLLLMMGGGGLIAVGLWAGGCLVGLAGVGMKSKRRK